MALVIAALKVAAARDRGRRHQSARDTGDLDVGGIPYAVGSDHGSLTLSEALRDGGVPLGNRLVAHDDVGGWVLSLSEVEPDQEPAMAGRRADAGIEGRFEDNGGEQGRLWQEVRLLDWRLAMSARSCSTV